MPVYDYACSNCGVRTEVIHGIHAEGPRFCPACGADGTLRKVVVAPTVVFKGSGWAKKDRSSSATAKSAASDGADGKTKPASTDGAPGAGEAGSSVKSGDTAAASKPASPTPTSD